MDDFESLRSKRVMISFIACCTALLTSGREISETTSKLLSGISAIHHKRRHSLEKLAKYRVRFGRKPGFVERLRHQFKPAVARRLIDLEWHVTHAETRMAALLFIGRRAAEAADEEGAHAILGLFLVVLRILGADDVIVRNQTKKHNHKPPKTFFADDGIILFFSLCD